MSRFDKMDGLFMAGEIGIKRSDGKESTFHNDTMLDHIPSAVRAIGGSDNGHVNKMGIGTSVDSPGNRNLNNMTSVTDNNEYSFIEEIDTVNFDNSITVDDKLYPNIAAVNFKNQFGEASSMLNNQELAEIALFTNDNTMFARRIIPKEERIPKERGLKITYNWTIFYGVNNPEA